MGAIKLSSGVCHVHNMLEQSKDDTCAVELLSAVCYIHHRPEQTKGSTRTVKISSGMCHIHHSSKTGVNLRKNDKGHH